MRLYEGTVLDFKEEVINNRMTDLLKRNFEDYYKRSANIREVRSWDMSLGKLKDVLDKAQLFENKIVIEHELHFSEKRIDAILFGKDNKGIELKLWKF